MTVTQKLRKVRLHGALGEKLGKESFDIAVNNTSQLWQALCYRFPDFEDEAMEHRELQVLVKYGEDFHAIGFDFMRADYADATEIHILPKVEGSGEAFVVWAFGAAFAATATGVVVAIAINIAVSIAISAVVASLAPKPKNSDNNSQSKGSRLYTGPAIYTEPGGAKAMIFGECLVNLTAISQAVGTQDIGLLE